MNNIWYLQRAISTTYNSCCEAFFWSKSFCVKSCWKQGHNQKYNSWGGQLHVSDRKYLLFFSHFLFLSVSVSCPISLPFPKLSFHGCSAFLFACVSEERTHRVNCHLYANCHQPPLGWSCGKRNLKNTCDPIQQDGSGWL